MTGQLIRVTTTQFQAVRFSQSARLVSSNSIDLERRKAIARMRAFQSKHSPTGRNMDMNYVNQINRTFSSNAANPVTTPSPRSASNTNAIASSASSGNKALSNKVASNVSYSSAIAATGTTDGMEASAIIPVGSSQGAVSTQDPQAALSLETDSAYTMDRGAFEFRVATGDLSFLPPLVMTVITQRPEVHFEYMGGFNYVAAGVLENSGWNSSI